MDESSAECKSFLVAGHCESEMFVVSDAMTHREHVRSHVFCSSYWKKDVKRLLTLEASDLFICFPNVQVNMAARVDAGIGVCICQT